MAPHKQVKLKGKKKRKENAIFVYLLFLNEFKSVMQSASSFFKSLYQPCVTCHGMLVKIAIKYGKIEK